MYDLYSANTIAAISTPEAEGGIAVIRVSGEGAIQTAAAVFRSHKGKDVLSAKTHTVMYGAAYDGDTRIDDCLLTIFRAPNSYTGEDIAELSVHGGVYSARRVLSVLFNSGATPANAGEFTRRAVLNGKMTLPQAEAVLDIIKADNEKALLFANERKNGAVAKIIDGVSEKLLSVSAQLTAINDFAENGGEDSEDSSVISDILPTLVQARKELKKLLSDRWFFDVVTNGYSVAILGKPNVGKSAIMNLLCGTEKSIVTDIAGTTRDIVEGRIEIDGYAVNLFDTAGLRETSDPIERIGVERMREKVRHADFVIVLHDHTRPFDDDDTAIKVLVNEHNKQAAYFENKADLPNGTGQDENACEPRISAYDPTSRDVIINRLRRMITQTRQNPENAYLSGERQLSAAKKASTALSDVITQAEGNAPLDIISALVSETLSALYELTGENVSENTLDAVFSKFCIGK
ncbi:MAG: tRNA uridine-5-carboxymethylaminomethyl(34) synthesis GTPase MnmE [Oscillospiraceae bacterium]|jgi:tRNA modification GTPase|nr:tRNA uridine-5-carboxymethylaminomethyl(34) synthesis GTPase MnmE [Oscillospiraceae bacterium]